MGFFSLGVCFVLLLLDTFLVWFGLVWFLPYLRTRLTTFKGKLENHSWFCFFLISRLLSL